MAAQDTDRISMFCFQAIQPASYICTAKLRTPCIIGPTSVIKPISPASPPATHVIQTV